MAGQERRPEAERPHLRERGASVVAAVPSASEYAAQVRSLARGFDENADIARRETNFDLRKLPFAVRLSEMTQANLDSIAAMFGTTVNQDRVLGKKRQTILIPGTDNKMIFHNDPKSDTDDAPLNPVHILLPKRPEEGIKEYLHIEPSDQPDDQDIVVVMGLGSVSFVNDTNRTEPPSAHIIRTMTPSGLFHTFEFDHLLFEDPHHALNLAKAITVFDPDITKEPTA